MLAALAEPGVVEEEEPAEEPAPEVVAAAAPAPRAREPEAPIRGSGSDVARTRPAPAPEPERPRVAAAAAPAPAPAPEPAATKPAMSRLPTSVVDTMVRNNKRIKRCWMDEKQRAGTIPRRLDVRFTVQPSGEVSSARVATKEYQGTDFDVCLGSAFRSITFPPFDGEPLTMKYSFVL